MVPRRMAAVKTKAPAKTTVKRAGTKKANATTTTATTTAATEQGSGAATKKHRAFTMSFASVYPLYVHKAERKGRTKEEVDEILAWLTGYSGAALQRVIDAKVDFETFFAEAPRMNPNVGLIRGVVCGVRVEEVADPLMQKIRYLDKLVDELANGKKMATVLRQ